MARKSIASRRKFVPPSIKEKMFNKDIENVKQYVYDSISTTSTASAGLTLQSQPKTLHIANTSDTVEFYAAISISIPSSSIPILSRTLMPVGSTLVLNSEDLPINPISKGVSVSITRKGSSGDATATVLATF
jgi:hypothetical protein